MVQAVNDDARLLDVEAALQLDVFKQIRKDLGMPKPPTPLAPEAVSAASGQRPPSGGTAQALAQPAPGGTAEAPIQETVAPSVAAAPFAMSSAGTSSRAFLAMSRAWTMGCHLWTMPMGSPMCQAVPMTRRLWRAMLPPLHHPGAWLPRGPPASWLPNHWLMKSLPDVWTRPMLR